MLTEDSIGVFARLEDPHGIFPSRAPHDESPPHLTLVSGLRVDAATLQGLREQAATVKPTVIRASRLAEFTNPEGVRIFHLRPEFEGTGLHELRERLRAYLAERGHRFSFDDKPWHPHITWAYVEDDRPLPDTDFAFEWTVREVEIWIYEKT